HADTVYRVHWLRAKAMRDRWAEEMLLVKHKMDWTCDFFLHKAENWIHLGNISRQVHKEGHLGYAVRQCKIYQCLYAEASHAF
ncbi:hypothetical protein DFJ58DRAFT_638866, partial [Suillus subalutaceus]|uniref:uncharacterized protein n=1 Tax=Suillus subalutaceus TaxID=48586 RepID=UPI001B85B805